MKDTEAAHVNFAPEWVRVTEMVRTDHFATGKPEPRAAMWIRLETIEQMEWNGSPNTHATIVRFAGGNSILVQERPEEILGLMAEG